MRDDTSDQFQHSACKDFVCSFLRRGSLTCAVLFSLSLLMLVLWIESRNVLTMAVTMTIGAVGLIMQTFHQAVHQACVVKAISRARKQ